MRFVFLKLPPTSNTFQVRQPDQPSFYASPLQEMLQKNGSILFLFYAAQQYFKSNLLFAGFEKSKFAVLFMLSSLWQEDRGQQDKR